MNHPLEMVGIALIKLNTSKSVFDKYLSKVNCIKLQIDMLDL